MESLPVSKDRPELCRNNFEEGKDSEEDCYLDPITGDCLGKNDEDIVINSNFDNDSGVWCYNRQTLRNKNMKRDPFDNRSDIRIVDVTHQYKKWNC